MYTVDVLFSAYINRDYVTCVYTSTEIWRGRNCKLSHDNFHNHVILGIHKNVQTRTRLGRAFVTQRY